MKKRKGYTFKSNGKWYARVTFTDPFGKRRNIKRTAKSKTDAKHALTKLKSDLLKNETKGILPVENIKRTFNDLADYYRSNYVKPAVFANDQKIEGLRDFEKIKCFVEIFKDYFGKRRVRDILHSDLVVFRLARLNTTTQYKKHRSITTVNRELSSLRCIFNIALRQGWIEKNPFNCGEPLILTSCERRRERILTIEEENRLLDACDNPHRRHLKPLLIALLDTGARKGEMLKLTWHDVDFENRLITFQALNTKTLKKRQVGITQRLLGELQELWEMSDKNVDSLVFGIKSNVRRSFSTACKIAGIKEGGIDGLTLHCLRHTAATRLVQGQLPIQMVGRILGHTQPQTTYRYLSANDETLVRAASILDAVQKRE